MNYQKYNASAIGQILTHCNRDGFATRRYGNEEIHKERTHLNYNLCTNHNGKKDIDYLNELVEQSKHINRKDVVKAVSICITLPTDFNGNAEEQKQFFKNCYEHFNSLYGEKNCISSYVHLDEKTPHMHYVFCPITKDNRLCAKEIIDKKELKIAHPRLEKYLRQKQPNLTINIMNDATRDGNKTVTELKRTTEIEKQKKIEQETQIAKEKLKKYKAEIDEYEKILKGKVEKNKKSFFSKNSEDYESLYNLECIANLKLKDEVNNRNIQISTLNSQLQSIRESMFQLEMSDRAFQHLLKELNSLEYVEKLYNTLKRKKEHERQYNSPISKDRRDSR